MPSFPSRARRRARDPIPGAWHPVVAVLVVLAALLAGCGSGSDDPSDPRGDGVVHDGKRLEKPDATALLTDDRTAPDDLVIDDLVSGSGDTAVPGTLVTVHYVGVDLASGAQFDASWDRGQTFSFRLGGGRVIEGWDRGVAGMRVGGRRALTIPPHLAYGERGAAPVIGPDATLLFVVDLLEVAAPPPVG